MDAQWVPLQKPLVQSPGTRQLLPTAQVFFPLATEVHEPPQSASVSSASFTPSLQCVVHVPFPSQNAPPFWVQLVPLGRSFVPQQPLSHVASMQSLAGFV